MTRSMAPLRQVTYSCLSYAHAPSPLPYYHRRSHFAFWTYIRSLHRHYAHNRPSTPYFNRTTKCFIGTHPILKIVKFFCTVIGFSNTSSSSSSRMNNTPSILHAISSTLGLFSVYLWFLFGLAGFVVDDWVEREAVDEKFVPYV